MNASPIRSPIRSAISGAIRSSLVPGIGAPVDYATTWRFYKGDAEFAKTPWAALTRTGLGTRIGPAGLVESTTSPRIDYSTGSAALLVEGQATNEWGNWNDFLASAWDLFGGRPPITPSAAAGPDGIVGSASEITISANNLRRLITIASGAAGAVAFFVKAASTGSATHTRLTTNNVGAWSTGISQKFALTSQWQRIELGGVLQTGSTSALVHLGVSGADGVIDPDCNGKMLIAFATAEVGTTKATSPIPNSGTGTAVRVADDWYLSGSALTAALGADTSVGAIFVEFICPSDTAFPFPSVWSVSTASELLAIWVNGSKRIALGGYSGVAPNSEILIDTTPVVAGQRVKAAIRWTASGYAGCVNGGSVVSSTNARNLASATAMRLGKAPFMSDRYLGDRIVSARVLDPNISDAALQALTA